MDVNLLRSAIIACEADCEQIDALLQPFLVPCRGESDAELAAPPLQPAAMVLASEVTAPLLADESQGAHEDRFAEMLLRAQADRADDLLLLDVVRERPGRPL